MRLAEHQHSVIADKLWSVVGIGHIGSEAL